MDRLKPVAYLRRSGRENLACVGFPLPVLHDVRFPLLHHNFPGFLNPSGTNIFSKNVTAPGSPKRASGVRTSVRPVPPQVRHGSNRRSVRPFTPSRYHPHRKARPFPETGITTPVLPASFLLLGLQAFFDLLLDLRVDRRVVFQQLLHRVPALRELAAVVAEP